MSQPSNEPAVSAPETAGMAAQGYTRQTAIQDQAIVARHGIKPGRMSAQMAALRDKLVADRRASSSSQDPKAGRDLVVWALRRLAPQDGLTERLKRWGARPRPDKRFDCGSPACTVCAARAAKREFDQKSAPALADLDRSRLRYVTILHLVTTDLDEGLHAMRTTQDRALRAIACKSGVHWWGYREVELLRPADLPNFSERKRSMLIDIGFPMDATTPVALFHTHSIIDLGACDEGMLDTLLRRRWSASRQVQVQTFMERRTVRESVRKLTLYSIKARYTREVEEDPREWLNESEMVHLALFLHRSSRGHQA